MQTIDRSEAARAGSVARPRAMAALFSGAALMNAAMAVASAVSTIVAGDRLGAGWGGVPNTAGIVGTGVGALALTRLMDRRGRRAGLAFGYAASALGAAIAAGAVAAGDVLLLIGGMLLLGVGNAGAQLSRYAAAELYPPRRRGFAIGTVIWAGTVGAVGGPLLIQAARDTAADLTWPPLTGPFAVAALAAAAAAVAATAAHGMRSGAVRPDGAGSGAVRPDAARAGGARTGSPRTGSPRAGAAPADAARAGAARAVPSRLPLRALAATSAARSALTVMVTAQVVMVAVMTAAPLDMHMHGEGLGAVGMVLSMHTLGMFALSPLTGRLVDRLGARPVMLGGILVLALATCLAALTSGGHPVAWTGALFLLGYGWNLCFVGGSGRLARDLPEADRTRVEGTVDAAVWGVSASASLASTALLSADGYAALAGTAGALLVIPAALLAAERLRRNAGPSGPPLREPYEEIR